MRLETKTGKTFQLSEQNIYMLFFTWYRIHCTLAAVCRLNNCFCMVQNRSKLKV
uniref:Uncharacterized protein n=1 Tax=Arundo donax TaxID=35708 RepID=A0A0A9FQV8_ARUDO